MQATVTKSGAIKLTFQYNRQLVEDLKASIDYKNREWKPASKEWLLRPTLDSLDFLITKNVCLSDEDVKRLSQALSDEKRKESTVDLIDEQRRALSNALTAPMIEDISKHLKLKLKPFQWVPVHYAQIADCRFVITDQMRMGKSIQALAVSLDEKWRHKPVLITTPVPYNWQQEIKKCLGEESIVLTDEFTELTPGVRYYIVTYHHTRLAQLFKNKEKKIVYDHIPEMFWIADEIHHLKNFSSLRTKYGRAIASEVTEVVGLTGTLIMNRAEEAYPIIKLLSPKSMTKAEFMKRFCGVSWNPNTRWNYYSVPTTNLKALREYLFNKCIIRRELWQVSDQMPTKLRQPIWLTDHLVDIEAESEVELCGNSAAEKAKAPVFKSWFKDLLEDTGEEKLIVFFHHQVMGDALAALCAQENIKYVRIDGKVSLEDRQKAVNQFQTEPQVKVILASLGVGTQGLDLSASSIIVFTEVDWVPGNNEQAESRTFHMEKSDLTTLIIYPLYSKFDDRIMKLNIEKIETIRRVTSVEEVEESASKGSVQDQIRAEFGFPPRKHKGKHQ